MAEVEFQYTPWYAVLYEDGMPRRLIERQPGQSDEELQAELSEWYTMEGMKHDAE